jgi:hypothetical protein
MANAYIFYQGLGILIARRLIAHAEDSIQA